MLYKIILILICANEKRHIEAYQALVRLFETIHIDNMKILKALIYSKDDLPLVDGLSKKRVCFKSHLIVIPLHSFVGYLITRTLREKRG